MKRALIYFDQESVQNSLELCAVLHRIYPRDEVVIEALNVSSHNDCLMGYVNTMLEVDGLESYDYCNITKLIKDLHNQDAYQCILFPSSKHGRIIAPRVAMALHCGLVADITALKVVDGKCEIIRPAYGGKIMAAIECLNETLMMSVRENVFSIDDFEPVNTKIKTLEVTNLIPKRVKLVSKIEKNESVQDIRKSDILVSGGFGILKNFNQLYELADLLGGSVSASRKIVDEGLVSRKVQVGQSGKTVSPKLYLALGISGSTQHIEGLRNIETIISVNTSEFAPLNYISDVVVLGDALEFTNRLIEKIIKERKG